MSVSTAGVSPASIIMGLFKLANGEYSAASVATDPDNARKLGLIKVKDGNFATPFFAGFPFSAVSQSSVGTQSALSSLVLGG